MSFEHEIRGRIYFQFLREIVPNNSRLVDIDPDDTFSSIPYEKGSFFLFYLEQIVGTADFEIFMRQWIHDVCFLEAETLQCLVFPRLILVVLVTIGVISSCVQY